MAVCLNSVFYSTAKHQHVPSTTIGVSVLKASHSFPGIVGFKSSMKEKKWGPCHLGANGDRAVTETSDKFPGSAERSFSDDQSSAVSLPSSDSPTTESQLEASIGTDSDSSSLEVSNGPAVSSDLNQDMSSAEVKTPMKRSRLTAREKLRAARVLSRSTESKPSKPALGSKVLEVLRESDRGKKRSGLPEAPTNLFDDSKRGMPKAGLTFDLPGGADVFLIIFSVVFISTVMFTTTYIVWKVGAIHFNEY